MITLLHCTCYYHQYFSCILFLYSLMSCYYYHCFIQLKIAQIFPCIYLLPLLFFSSPPFLYLISSLWHNLFNYELYPLVGILNFCLSSCSTARYKTTGHQLFVFTIWNILFHYLLIVAIEKFNLILFYWCGKFKNFRTDQGRDKTMR